MKLCGFILDDIMYVYVGVQECVCTAISYTKRFTD